jgi:parvulin-like peptidyl-prolyl isomerase
MGMMAKMRSLAPWFIITVGGLFVIFMVLSDSKIGDIIGRQSNFVGSINGEEISYQEYSQLYESYRQYQLQTSGQEVPESQLEVLRDNVWQNIVRQRLMTTKIEEYGITVSDEEVRESLLGPNPPASVTQYFIDSTGIFNREAYEAAIYNPQNKQAVLQLEDQVRQELLQSKLQNQINASIIVSDEEIKQRFLDQNIKMNADYVVVNWSTINDSVITFTDADIEDYYNKNKNNYKIESQRKIKYVLFERKATPGDSAGLRDNLSEIMKDIASDTSSFKTFVEIYSEQPYSRDTLQLSKIPQGAQSAIENGKKGDILGPLLTNEGYAVYRIADTKRSKEEIVRASHILIKSEDPDDNSEAMKVYNDLIGGADFAETAIELSQDPGSGAIGGDLGWFGKGQMVREFENAAFKGRIDRIQKPVKSQFGWHIIKTTGKSNTDYVVEKIVNKIEPSATTIDQLFENASDFAYLADRDGFDMIVDELGYQVVESAPFTEDSRSIPGLGSNKALIKFAFDNSTGSVSEVYRVTSGYTAVMVSEEIDAGFKPIDEVRTSIESNVKREKKKEKALEIAGDIRSKIGDLGDLNIANEIYPNSKVASVNNFTPSGTVPTLGREYAFASIASEMNINEVSDAFMGNRGGFIVKLTSKTNFDSTAYSIQKNGLRDNILQQKRSRLFSDWLSSIENEADIEDNRHLFYR